MNVHNYCPVCKEFRTDVLIEDEITREMLEELECSECGYRFFNWLKEERKQD